MHQRECEYFKNNLIYIFFILRLIFRARFGQTINNMKNSGISRKDFLRNSVLGVAGLTFGSGILNSLNAASPEAEPDLKGISGNFTLKNVRLETGFEYKDGEVDRRRQNYL